MNDTFDKLIEKNPVVIISKPFCPQCDVIKNNLKDTNTSFTNVDVSTLEDEYDIDAFTFIDNLKEYTGGTSFPFCFYEGSYIKMEELRKKLIKFNFSEDTEDF
jgi:glutaredoxin